MEKGGETLAFIHEIYADHWPVAAVAAEESQVAVHGGLCEAFAVAFLKKYSQS